MSPSCALLRVVILKQTCYRTKRSRRCHAANTDGRGSHISKTGSLRSFIRIEMTLAVVGASYALKSVEAAAEELRVNDVDVQSSADNAELLSQLTAGTYA